MRHQAPDWYFVKRNRCLTFEITEHNDIPWMVNFQNEVGLYDEDNDMMPIIRFGNWCFI